MLGAYPWGAGTCAPRRGLGAALKGCPSRFTKLSVRCFPATQTGVGSCSQSGGSTIGI